jgi:multicomponent Na+:H+ antiporter subunit D
VRRGSTSRQYVIVTVALGVSLLTLFSMTKIWAEAFWKPTPEGSTGVGLTRAGWRQTLGPVAALALVTVAIGAFAEPVLALAMRAAEQLLDPAEYVRAVFGVRG